MTVLAAAVGVVAFACGGGPSLGEYASEVEGLVVPMNAALDELQTRVESGGGAPEDQVAYWDARVAIRRAFLEDLEDIVPADEAEVLHEAAFEAISRLLAAERAYAAAVREASSPAEVAAIEAGPLGAAFRSADAETIAICRAANDELAETESRKMFRDVLWVPDELREVVDVAFRCTAVERMGGG